jgi:hypothetical protein
MRRSGRGLKVAWVVVAGGVTLAASGALLAQAPPPSPAVDPTAIAAVTKMGAFLRAQQSMWVQAETTTDDVLPSGQKVQVNGTVDLKARRPNRLHVELVSDRKNEQLYYDGVTFTVYQPTAGYYASFAAPPTLHELVDVLEKRYGIDLPLADLFRLGTDEAQIAAIIGARKIGFSTVKNATCTHYAFHQADVDWELWIQEGAQPLPRKLVITTLGDKTEPQHTSVMTWDLAPKLDEQTFVFAAPPNATRINFDIDDVAPGKHPGGAVNPKKEGTP